MSDLRRLEDIEEFDLAARIPRGAIDEEIQESVRELGEEETLEPGIRAALMDPTETPHGPTEQADILTPHVTVNGESRLAAFVNKGKSWKRVRAKDVAHQLQRAARTEGVETVALAATGHVQDSAIESLTQSANEAGADALLLDAIDVARILIATNAICPVDGSAYTEGVCPDCGREAEDPLELSIKIHEEPRYRLAELQDTSHAGAKRLSASVVTDPHYQKNVIREVIKEATQEVRESTYCRSEQVRAHHGDAPPDVVFVNLYRTQEDYEDGNSFCRAVWVDSELPERYHPFVSEDEQIGEIAIAWSDSYRLLRELHEENRIPKDQWMTVVRSLADRAKALLREMEEVVEAYEAGRIDWEGYQNEMRRIEGIAWEISDTAADLGFPPSDCKDADTAAQAFLGGVIDPVLPTSEKGATDHEPEDALWLANDTIERLQEDEARFEAEWERLPR